MEGHDIKLREVDLKDLHVIVNLLHQLSPSTTEHDMEHLKTILEKIKHDSHHHLYVVEEKSQVIGCGLLLMQMNLSHGGRPYAHIENIVVDQNHRGKGLGKKIIRHLIDIAKENKCHKVILDCKEDNIPFYAKCGMFNTKEVSMRLDFD